MSTQERIVAIIRRVSGKNVTPGPDDELFESGLLDSFALVDVVGELERQFSIKIPDADLHPRTFASVSRIQTYVESR